jgi:hypothetical protein
MHCGEITGQIFDITKEDVGMPFRSVTLSKKGERKNISVMDDIINEDNRELSPTFDYYDPTSTLYARDASEQMNCSTNTDEPRLNFDREQLRLPYGRQISGANPMQRLDNTTRNIDVDTETRNQKIKQQTRTVNTGFDKNVQNISSYNTEYINNISFNIYNEISRGTYVNFCAFPIGIISTFVKNDQNVKKIMSVINTNEIFHQLKMLHTNNTITSRASVALNLIPSKVSEIFSHYEDNDNHVVEIPMDNPNFSIGFVHSKNGKEIQMSHKLFSVYVTNLKRSNVDVYCPAFKITNNLSLNNILKSMGYIRGGDIGYMQTIYFELQNNVYIKKTAARSLSVREPIDLSDNFIFYIRYVPNNIVLFIGRHGEL